MELQRDTEIKEIEVFETQTYRFKIASEKLNKIKENISNPKTLAKIRTIIQRSMKQTAEVCKGQDWQESFELIFKDISEGQTIL
jgi:putative hemolysin